MGYFWFVAPTSIGCLEIHLLTSATSGLANPTFIMIASSQPYLLASNTQKLRVEITEAMALEGVASRRGDGKLKDSKSLA